MEESTQSLSSAIIGLVGVLFGAGATALTQWLMQRRNEKLERIYVTSNLVAALDQLAIDCAMVAFDDGTTDGQPGKDGHHHPQKPDPKFSLTADQGSLKYLDSVITYKVLVIPHRIRSISHTVSNELEYDDPPAYRRTFETRQLSFAQLGLDIAQISDQIRREYGVPHRPPEIWNPVPDLQGKMTDINERRVKRQRMGLVQGS